jgi:hypothetical protein
MLSESSICASNFRMDPITCFGTISGPIVLYSTLHSKVQSVHSEGVEREEDDATEEARGVGVDEGARAVLGAETEAEADTETGDALAGVLEGVGADLDMPFGLSEEVAVEDEDEVAVVLDAFRAVRVEDLAGAGEVAGEVDLTGGTATTGKVNAATTGASGAAGTAGTGASDGAVVQCREWGIDSTLLLYAGVIASMPVRFPCSLEHKVSNSFFHAFRSLSVS